MARSGYQNNQVVHGFGHWFLIEGNCYKYRVSDHQENQCQKFSFVYLHKTYHAKFLLHKHCKEGATIITYF